MWGGGAYKREFTVFIFAHRYSMTLQNGMDD